MMRKDMKRCVLWSAGCLALGLWLGPAPSWAADVPVVGVVTGDATRGPLVDYLRAMAGVRLDTPGYDLLNPDRTARLIDEIARPYRDVQAEALSRDVERHLQSAGDAVASEEWERAKNEAERALLLIERDGGKRIPLGASDAWLQARMLLASAWILDQPKVKKGGRRGPTDEAVAAAAEVLRPIMVRQEQYQPRAGHYDAQVLDVLERVRQEVRRTGALTVRSVARGADVFVDGHRIGQTPLEAYRLSPGTYEVQVGRAERPGRIRTLTIASGENSTIEVDPSFEYDLVTTGFAMIEAPPGQSAAPSAVQYGGAVARMTGNRYALVFAVEGAKPLTMYAAMVDADTNVVLRDKRIPIEGSRVENGKLHEILYFAIEGKAVDHSWPAVRWGWIGTTTATVAFAATSVVFLAMAESTLSDAKKRDQYSSQVRKLEDEAGTQQTVSLLFMGAALLTGGITAVLMVKDFTDDEPRYIVYEDAPWWLSVAPLLGEDGLGGGTVGVGWRF